MYHDWDIRLADYVESVREKSFEWGKFDCLIFANGAVRAQTGKGFCNDWMGDYTDAQSCYKHALRLLKANRWDNIVEAIDTRLTRLQSLMPHRGNIIGRQQEHMSVTGISLGVAVSDQIAFVGNNGIEFSAPQEDDIFWLI
jgi:hypothetical protein